MMEAILVVIVCALMVLILLFAGAHLGHKETMQEAYDRGLAVQCVGKVGYHWECEE